VPAHSLVVLQSVPEPKPTTNPYVVQLIERLRAAGLEVRTFSWRAALTSRYDVFHVHWPEILARGNTRTRTLARQLALLVLLLRLQATGTPIVRTLHNTSRHEGGTRREALLMKLVDRWTRYGIAINAHTVPPEGLPTTTIPHGHYRDWYAPFARPDPVAGRLAYFGLIRPYKGVEELIGAFRTLPGDGLSLTVSGRPRTPELAADLNQRAAGDERITLELDYLSDEQLVRRLGEAELVVLPYRQMHNSGAALAALSLDRPVLVPANPINADLAAEVGSGWVHTFTGDLTSESLRAGLQALDIVQRSPTPDLSQREWADTGERHRAAYAEAIRLQSLRRRRLNSA
jgi:glycosyltransferase involved in cell wall biosynthesis